MTARTPNPPDDCDTDADRADGPAAGVRPARYRATVGHRHAAAGRCSEVSR